MNTTSYEIHPALGVARVGSSRDATPEGVFYGPEPGGSPPESYRDPAGDLKRQAARFSVFRCVRDAGRHLVEATEVTLWDARITWTVHLANRKGVSPRSFSGPGRRNRATGDDDRDRHLIIDPGPRAVSAPGEHKTFDTGCFRSTAVDLGELAMEDDGRLRVLGGFGRSGSDPPQPRLSFRTGHYADNNAWYDDTSDGPVQAAVALDDGSVHEATAWVLVGPPDFAPGITNLITLFDYLYDRAVARNLLADPAERPSRVSFTRHVQPILERALGYRWVNRYAHAGFHDQGKGHGPGRAGDYSSFWPVLAGASAEGRELRAKLFGHLRNPDRRGPQPVHHVSKWMPRLNAPVLGRSGPGNVLPLTPTQYKILRAWSEGDFENDLGLPLNLDELLPDAIDRMALEACVGGAFYPGIEVSNVILARSSSYLPGEPFRLSPDAVRPGELTQHNAVPWQADFHICRWEDREGPLLKRMGWWPAQRPDDVFTRVGAAEMVSWARGLGDDYQDMVDKWDRLGFVVDHGTATEPFFMEQERDSDLLGP